MNRFLAVISITLLLFNLFGYDTLFQLEKDHIQHTWKQKLKKGVPTDDLYHFQFSKEEWNNLKWTKPNKEFKIGEQFYDVVYRVIQDGNYLIQAVSDDQETKLFQNLAEIVHQSWKDIPTQESPSKIWQVSVSDLYLLSKGQLSTNIQIDAKHYTTWHHSYTLPKLNTVWHPPQGGLIAYRKLFYV
jgi:hypothetical protein